MHIESGGVSGEAEGENMFVHLPLLIAIEFQFTIPSQASGAIVWQLNDCWPVISWAIVDYFVRILNHDDCQIDSRIERCHTYSFVLSQHGTASKGNWLHSQLEYSAR